MNFGLKEFHARARQATIRVPLPTRIPQVGDYEDDVGVPTSRKKAGTNGDSRSRKQDYFDEGEDDEGDFEDGFDDYDEDEGGGKRRRKLAKFGRGDVKNMSHQEKLERRERNREHAKRSRIRKKVLLDSLQDQLEMMRKENALLRQYVAESIPNKAHQILEDCTTPESQLLADENLGIDLRENTKPLVFDSTGQPIIQGAKILVEPDFRLIQALVTSQQNFVVSDPSLPDNPIVYASDGFCKLSGYKRRDILGRNCRFLQGPGTDQAAVDTIRKGVEDGRDISVCLLNYKADGTPFWNQFFVAALKDSDGHVVNYVGVQCEVNTLPIAELKDRVKRLPMPESM